MTHNLQELSMNHEGILLVNKPEGKTSFHLVHKLRQITKIQKIGHCGTLDPFATGVMVMLVGKNYTRLSNLLISQDKQYLATIHLGAISSTYDKDGEISHTSYEIPSQKEIEEILKGFQGETLQTPPMFSAKKVGGKKLYELARKGIEIERKAQPVHLNITLIEYNYPYLTIDVSCSKGTYIRSLAYDIGNRLKVGGYLEKLIRLRSGRYCLEDCIDYSTLTSIGFNYTHHLLKVDESLKEELTV